MTGGLARQDFNAGVTVHPQLFIEVWKSQTAPETVE